jgi:hypothetical protein
MHASSFSVRGRPGRGLHAVLMHGLPGRSCGGGSGIPWTRSWRAIDNVQVPKPMLNIDAPEDVAEQLEEVAQALYARWLLVTSAVVVYGLAAG